MKRPRKVKSPSIRIKLPSFGDIIFPRFWNFRLPLPGGIYVAGGPLVLGSFTVAALGFLAASFIYMNTGEVDILWPDAGAVYNAPSLVGQAAHDPEEPSRRSMTLQLNIGQGERISEITLRDMSLGKAGITDALQLTGTSTTDVLVIEKLTVKNSSFPTFDIANADIHTIIATTSVETAGHTVSPTLASSTAAVSIGGTRNSVKYISDGGTVDRIIIRQSTSGGDVFIKEMTIDNVHSYIGQLNFDNLSIGTLILENIKIGDDGDVDNDSDFIVNSSVNVNTVTESIVDVPIFIR